MARKNGGTAFYFIQYSPRKVKYCADFQSLSNESYFDFHREAGWNHIYSSYSSFQKWTIWSREFADGEKSYQLKHARRVAIIYTMMFLPLVALYIFMGVFLNNLPKMNIAIYLLCIFVFGSYIVRLWLYYIRLRKQNDFRSP